MFTQVAQRHRYDVVRYRHEDVVTTSPMHHGPTSSRHPDDMATIWRRHGDDVVAMSSRCHYDVRTKFGNTGQKFKKCLYN